MTSFRDFLLKRNVEPILPEWEGYTPQGVWSGFLQLVDLGIDDVHLSDIRRLYSRVVAHQVYAGSLVAAYDGAVYRLTHNSRSLYADGFGEEIGSAEARRQGAFKRHDYVAESAALAGYKDERVRAEAVAVGMGLIATFLSRELSARAIEIELMKGDTDEGN